MKRAQMLLGQAKELSRQSNNPDISLEESDDLKKQAAHLRRAAQLVQEEEGYLTNEEREVITLM